uniref:Uncharacterized protein n=1 Tax=Oryza glumipatula TaxID=40148 RepID=A0A0D9ZBZ7_9ORYZ
MPIAIETNTAKAQHYELPTSFFKLVLGRHLKYSSCYFRDNSTTLEDAEVAMMELYCERAQIQCGQTILDLGITGICNSVTQKAFIEEQYKERQLSNVDIFLADINNFEMDRSFDRIISIGLFEHMKNCEALLRKISMWMKEDTLLFVEHFCHKTFAYHFEDNNNNDDWMTRHFFYGGTMPSASLLLYFQENVSVIDHWLVSGTHYARTSEEWLKRMDTNLASIRPIFDATYGRDASTKWLAYWRTLFISVAELFGYNNGEEWMMTQYLFKKK